MTNDTFNGELDAPRGFVPFDGELDPPAGFVPFDGELDPPTTALRRGGTRAEAQRAIDSQNFRGGHGFAAQDPRRLDQRPATPAEPPPYRDRREALDDAVNLVEEGAPLPRVLESFGKLGITESELTSRAQARKSERFAQARDQMQPAPAGLQGSGSITPVEPTRAQEAGNMLRRGVEQAGGTVDAMAFQAGIVDAPTMAQMTAQRQRRTEAASASGDIAAGLERLQKANETGSWSEVASQLVAPENWKAVASLVVESAIGSSPMLLTTVAGSALAGPVGAAAGAGAGSFSVEYAQALGDTLDKAKVDKGDPAALEKALTNPAILSEARQRGLARGIPVGAFDAISAGFAGRFLRAVEKAKDSGALAAKAVPRAIVGAGGKEAALQVGSGMAGEQAGQWAVGESKPLDVFLEGLAELPGGVVEAAGNIRHARAQDPMRQVASAFDADIADTHFQPGAISGYAQRAGDARFYDPTFIDPRAPRAANPQPATPGAAVELPPDAVVEPLAQPAAEPAVPVRMEDMPTTPMTPEQVTLLAARARDNRPSEAQAGPSAGLNGVGATDAPANASMGRQTAAQQADAVAEVVPAIARGSLAAEARRVLEARQQGAVDAIPASQVAQSQPQDQRAAPAGPQLRRVEAEQSTPHQETIHDAAARGEARPAPATAAQATAGAKSRGSASHDGDLGSGKADGGQQLPTFETKGRALVWLVENRRSAELQPVEAGGRWALQPRRIPGSQTEGQPLAEAAAPATTAQSSPPRGAQSGVAVGQSAAATHFERGPAFGLTGDGFEPSSMPRRTDDAPTEASRPSGAPEISIGDPREIQGRLQFDAHRTFTPKERLHVQLREIQPGSWQAKLTAVDRTTGHRQLRPIAEIHGDAHSAAAQLRELMSRLLRDGTLASLPVVHNTAERPMEAARHLVVASPGHEMSARIEAPTAQAAQPASASGDDVLGLAGRLPHELTAAEFEAGSDIARTGTGDRPWTARWRGQLIGDDAGRQTFASRKEAIAAVRSAHQRAVARSGTGAVERQTQPATGQTPDVGGSAKPGAPDKATIDRKLARFSADGFKRLEGLEITLKVHLTGGGRTETLTGNAASYLRDLAMRRKAIDEGRLPETESAARRFNKYLGAGLAEQQALGQTLRAELTQTLWLQAAALQALREQHPAVLSIEDAGAKIGGARKDWRNRGLNVEDLDRMAEAEGAELVSKAAVWRPDWQSMVSAGAEPHAVALVKIVVDRLAAKPKENTPQGRRDYVRAMQAVRQVFGDVKTEADANAAAQRLRAQLGVSSGLIVSDAERAARRVLFSIYKGRSDPFSLDRADAARARRMVSDGFPGTVAPWIKKFEILPAGGAGSTEAGVAALVDRADGLGTPVTAEQARAGVFNVISRKTRRTVAIAATQADAEATAAATYERERSSSDGKAVPERPHLDSIARDGMSSTLDRDAAATDFIDTFGFRGVEWGNWAAQDERQKIANLAFDGLSDLATILNVPPKALSLNGTLGLAFGARGGGRFAAHYEPGKMVINMTKLRGAGSLAHEWAHGFDHYLGELDRIDAYTTGARGASGWYVQGRYDGQPQRRMERDATGQWNPVTSRRLGNLRPELASRVDAVMHALYTARQSKADMLQELDGNIERAVSNAAKSLAEADLRAMYERQAEGLRQARARIESDPDLTTYPKGRSMFAVQAQQLSGKSSTGYWLRPTEMFARAFEAYVFDRLATMGARSEYLVHGVEEERYASSLYRGNPYPTGAERQVINKAFDDLVAELKTRTGDDGKVALFQRKVDDSAERAALRALSENDELFALPRSSATTIQAIASEIDPAIKVKANESEGLSHYDLTMPDGSQATITVREASPHGPHSFHNLYSSDNDLKVTRTVRPGDNPEVVEPDVGDVWINVIRLTPGAGGAKVYAIAGDFAHNTGRIFIGDPNGLSDDALRRRPEAMLSSALRWGTTEHLAPGYQQVWGSSAAGIKPLRWVYGDHIGNIRRLVELNLDSLSTAATTATRLDFDVNTGHFIDASTGRPILDSRLGGMADESWRRGGVASKALAGRRTIARGAVLRALVREEGREGEGDGRRDGLLARLARLAAQPLGAERLAGLFSRRSGAADSELTPDGVRAVASEITRSWGNAPEVVVIQGMVQAPDAVQLENQRQLSAGASGAPAAFWYGGKVYLVATELRTLREVAEAIAHEVLAHHGLRGTFGAGLGAVLSDVARLREADVRAKAASYGLDFDNDAQRLRAAEEVLAELAQSEPTSTLVQRALAAIRSWLRKNIPGLANLQFSDAELIERFIVPARQWVMSGEGARDPGLTPQPAQAFHRDVSRQEVGPYYSQLARDVQALSLKTAAPSVWQLHFRSLTRHGIKPEEIQWSGVQEWLDLQPGPVSQADVVAYLDDNGIKVEEHRFGGPPATADDVHVEYDANAWGPGSGGWAVLVAGHEIDVVAEEAAARALAQDLASNPQELAQYNGTRYPGQVQPGGTNPRELVLALPGAERFESQHWRDIPNVLAHIRTSERKGTDGKRVLFVEEIQSDWSDALRAARKSGTGDVQPGPFVRNDAWVALALKATIRQAVADGFDRVAFATGTQVSELFPFADGDDGGSTRSARSRFYGEADGRVVDGRGRKTEGKPVLQNVAREVLSKLGGPALSSVKLRAGRGMRPTSQVGFEITPELRAVASQGLPLFARGKAGRSEMDGFRSWLQGGPRGPLPPATNTMLKGPQAEPVSDAGSRPTDPDFGPWFADSKVVDGAGRPRAVFGLVNPQGRFPRLPLGTFGAGRYFVATPEGTRNLSDERSFYDQTAQPRPVYLRLINPYILEGARRVMPEGWEEPKSFSPEVLQRLRRELRSPAAGLVKAVMPTSSAEQMLARIFHGGALLGEAVTNRLRELGHDGLIVRYADAADGEETLVAFEADQIREAALSQGRVEAMPDSPVLFQRVARSFALRQFGRAGHAIEVIQDRYNRWKHAIEDVRRQGGTVTDANDFYRAEERYWGQVGSQLEDFKDDLTRFVRGVASDGLRIEDVALYAYALHAEERNEWVAGRRRDLPDGGSGMTTAEADEILEAARQAGVETELQRHAATLRGWIQGTRDVLLHGGLIDQRAYDTWTGMFRHYVPLRGAADEASGELPMGPRRGRPTGGVRGEETEHATGRSSQALQIIEQVAHDRARALIRAGRNNVLRAFAKFVLDNPSPELWEVNAVESRRESIVDEDGYRRVQEREQVIQDGRTITLKDGGEEIHILVKDPKLLEQLQRLGVDDRPAWAIGALMSANRWLSRVYTSLSPVFTVINALRDTQAAAVGMIDEIGFLGAAKLFAALPGAWVDSFQAEAGKPSTEYQLFKAMGGVTHFHNLTTIEQQSDELAAIVADANRSALDPHKFLPKAMALIESLNGGIENATRLAAFKVARQSGKSSIEAASLAKNITVNFNRKGTQQLASAWVLFFNPAVQGTVRVAQAMSSPKVLATIGTAMMGVAALALRNASMGDDDDGVAWWDKIPDEVKERNIVIVLPPGATKGEGVPGSKVGRYIKIPMAYGYNFFAVVANQVIDIWRHSQDPRRGRDVVRAGAKAFGAFTASWLPSSDLGRAMTADSAETAGKSAVLLAIPDALDPLARIGLNQDSFGRPMRPDSRSGRHLPDAMNYFPGQHGTLAQRGAAALNSATGGSRFREGLADVAPATLEHLARSYGGGPVGFGLDIVNALYLRQSIARPELDAKRLPFAKQFYATIDAETDRMTGYQRLEQAEKLIEPIERAVKAGDRDEARAMRDEAGPVVALGSAVQLTRQRLADIVKRERATIDSATLTDAAKYEHLVELAERRRQALQAFNKAYDRAVLATVERKELKQ